MAFGRKTPRKTAKILSSFTSLVDELNARSAASIAEAEREDALVDEHAALAISARTEAQRASQAAEKIGDLIGVVGS